MKLYHSKYVSVAEAAEHTGRMIQRIDEIYGEFARKYRDLPQELRWPYLREGTANEPEGRERVRAAWFHLYVRLNFLQEAFAGAGDRKLLLLTMPNGTAYQGIDQLLYEADLSEGVVMGNA